MLTIIDYKLGKIAKLENTKTLLGNVFSVPDYNENSMTVYFANDGETLKELIKFELNSQNFITTIKFGNDLNQTQKEYIDSEIKREFKLYLNHTKFVNEE